MASVSVAPDSASTLLRNSSQLDLRILTAIETEESVILTGMVPSYYIKQLAQETVLPLLGERRLHNHLAVVRPKG